jgi:hypothetical protein
MSVSLNPGVSTSTTSRPVHRNRGETWILSVLECRLWPTSRLDPDDMFMNCVSHPQRLIRRRESILTHCFATPGTHYSATNPESKYRKNFGSLRRTQTQQDHPKEGHQQELNCGNLIFNLCATPTWQLCPGVKHLCPRRLKQSWRLAVTALGVVCKWNLKLTKDTTNCFIVFQVSA